jgi:hypothetical protein
MAKSEFARSQTLLGNEPNYFTRLVGEELDFALNIENGLIECFKPWTVQSPS